MMTSVVERVQEAPIIVCDVVEVMHWLLLCQKLGSDALAVVYTSLSGIRVLNLGCLLRSLL